MEERDKGMVIHYKVTSDEYANLTESDVKGKYKDCVFFVQDDEKSGHIMCNGIRYTTSSTAGGNTNTTPQIPTFTGTNSINGVFRPDIDTSFLRHINFVDIGHITTINDERYKVLWGDRDISINENGFPVYFTWGSQFGVYNDPDNFGETINCPNTTAHLRHTPLFGDDTIKCIAGRDEYDTAVYWCSKIGEGVKDCVMPSRQMFLELFGVDDDIHWHFNNENGTYNYENDLCDYELSDNNVLTMKSRQNPGNHITFNLGQGAVACSDFKLSDKLVDSAPLNYIFGCDKNVAGNWAGEEPNPLKIKNNWGAWWTCDYTDKFNAQCFNILIDNSWVTWDGWQDTWVQNKNEMFTSLNKMIGLPIRPVQLLKITE